MKKLFLTLFVLLAMIFGYASGAVGYWASNSSMLVNGIDSPILRSTIVSPIAAGAGHVAGGTTANLFAGQSLDDAFSNSFKGIGTSMAVGGAIGVASTIGISYANKINPWTGEKIVAKGETKAITQFSGSTIDDAVNLVMNDANKLNHLFPAKHNLEGLVNQLGGQESTIRTVLNAANGKLPVSGVFNNISVNVGGQTVFIRGSVVNGIPRLGTMYIP